MKQKLFLQLEKTQSLKSPRSALKPQDGVETLKWQQKRKPNCDHNNEETPPREAAKRKFDQTTTITTTTTGEETNKDKAESRVRRSTDQSRKAIHTIMVMGIKKDKKSDSSSTSPCAHLRAAYHQCFNRWYSEKFLKGQWNKEECVSEWQKYRACLTQHLEDKHLSRFLEAEATVYPPPESWPR